MVNWKKIRNDVAYVALGLSTLYGGSALLRGCGATEQEVMKRRLAHEYRSSQIETQLRFERDTDVNRDGERSIEEWNNALQLGGYDGPKLPSGEYPQDWFNITNNAIPLLEKERYKEIER